LNAPLPLPDAKQALAPEQGGLAGATRDAQSIGRDWQSLQETIAGVVVREVRNVPKDNGCLTEIWRDDWGLAPPAIAQVFQVALAPGAVSAWHAHRDATDRLFANAGQMKIVLYDARAGSPTAGRVNVFRCGALRPMLVVIPPGVWHGVQNLSHEPSLLLNLPDRAYAYEAPDHWRLPPETERIPYSFARAGEPAGVGPGRI